MKHYGHSEIQGLRLKKNDSDILKMLIAARKGQEVWIEREDGFEYRFKRVR